MKYALRATKPLSVRFWEKVDTSGVCWLWLGTKLPSGYGRIGLGRRGSGWEYAHRVSYLLYAGELPREAIVAHHCDNPSCVRPTHLFLTDTAGNVADKVAKGRARGRLSQPSTLIHARQA